ncbi:O-antigen ligase family protein [Variovorax sp. YR752]|uniref:O-antigen ligase family protein n=1 Tax=Variovorax sp. YR752 TaxID=1884383 RepID=UPI0031383DC0
MPLTSLLMLGSAFLMVALFGLLIPLLVVGSQRSPVFGVGVVGALHLVDTWFVGALALPLGLAVTPFDFAFVVLALATMARARQLPLDDRIVRLWLGACVVWFALFAIGAVLHKTKAGVEYRPFFYLSVGVTYMLSFRIDPAAARRVLGNIALFACGTLLIAMYRWGMDALSPGLHYWQESPGQFNWRVINAQQTFILVALLLTGLSATMNRSRDITGAWWLLTPAFFLAVVALQHRTNWVVLVAAAMVLLAVQRSRAGSRKALTVALLLGMLAVVAAGSMLGGFGESIQNSVAEPFKQKSTINWRFDSWREVIRSWATGGPAVWPFGFPFGNGWRRFIESSGQTGLFWEVSPHSFYVTTLARGGIVALGLVVTSLCLAASRHLRRQGGGIQPWPDAALMVTLLAAQSIFFITYSIIPVATLFLGLTLGTAVRPQRSEAPAVRRQPGWRLDAEAA